MFEHLAIWVCIIGGAVFMICTFVTGTTESSKTLIANISKMAFAAYWVGLLAWLFGH